MALHPLEQPLLVLRTTFPPAGELKFLPLTYIILRGALIVVRRTFITHYALRIKNYTVR